MKETLADKIASKKAIVGIIGLGYVGLPLMREYCRGGLKVVGFDVDSEKVKKLNAGKSYIQHIPSSLIKEYVSNKQFRATTDMKELRKVDAIIICVPTPLTKTRDPDMKYIVGTAEAISPNLQKGQLVVLESTTYPGTTREVVKPILERSGLKAGKDFYLAFSPEREDPGRKDFSTGTIPKVVGADDPVSRDYACKLYSSAVKTVVAVSSTDVAESAKLLENIYRCVNIAMVNELKMLFDRMGIDVWEVINAAKTKPFGFQAFYPGPGLGGHCIPIDPFYLTWMAREFETATRFIELAGEINTGMPNYVVTRTMEALNEKGKSLKGSKVLVLGLAYKKDVDDLRESPSVILVEMLKKHGAKVDYNDPHIAKTPKQREHDLRMTSKPLSPKMLAGYDAVLIATDHSAYDYNMIVKNAKLVIDTRNATANVKQGRNKIVKA
ncbi:MAG: nucleotide sugar dehydrogenase [Phycisphaerae bacterium]|nr:nucleotide sugar dehydrogenase [Phycisphaerae bacterium]